MKIKALFTLFFTLFSLSVFATSSNCSLSSGINVNTAKRLLTICKQGQVVKTFRVAIGNKGVGKRRTGDNKTPVGLYNLSQARKSNHFKLFIPILYPTAKQLAQGYSGRDVGIHGPTQSSQLFSWFSNLPGSTRGCIAVGTNNQIEYVANWLKTNPAGAKVLII